MTRQALKAGLFLAAGFLCALALIERAAPFDYDVPFRVKFRFFKAHKDDYTILVFGTSRTYREIVPSRLDAALSASGVESRTFNMGLPGMEVLRAHFILERIAELRPKRLKYLIVDTAMGGDKYREGPLDPIDTENVFWRTPEEEVRDLVNHLSTTPNLCSFLALASRSLRLAIYRFTNRGILGIAAYEALYGPPHTPVEPLVLAGQGYLPLESDTYPFFIDLHKEFLAHPETFAKFLDEAPDPFAPAGPSDSPEYRGYQALLSLANRAGWKVLLIRPLLQPPGFSTGCETPRAGCAEIGFEDRKRYADFYRYSSYYDYVHLNRAAAARFTDLVAGQMLALPGFLERP